MNQHKLPTAIVVPSQYLPPVSVLYLIEPYPELLIPEDEPFKKSTWRNRCKIAGANGTVLLTIPVEGGRGTKNAMKDVRIDYRQPWQRIHWTAIVSAYGKSSYFIYYADQLKQCYLKNHVFLADLNHDLLQTCFRLLKIDKKISRVNGAYVDDNNLQRLENTITPPDLPQYRQVFQERHGFIPDLSVIDLIFNAGPQFNSWSG
jgi:hypothetical protein